MRRAVFLAFACSVALQGLVWSPDGSAQPLDQPGDWRLVFSDEFDGARLDPTKWRPNWLGPDNPVSASPHYLILNLDLRRGTANYPLLATLRVDCVRVWQQN